MARDGIGGGPGFWEAVKGNLTVLSDAKTWWRVVHDDREPAVEDKSLTAAAARLLPPEPWSLETWGQWTNAIKAETGAKGKALFHPLRLALTGQEAGPELKVLLPMIGRARALKRLGAG